MKYKGVTVLEPTARWLKVDGTEYPKCSACGHLQDIWDDGSDRCIYCGAWMVTRMVKDDRQNPFIEEMLDLAYANKHLAEKIGWKEKKNELRKSDRSDFRTGADKV